MRHAGFFIALLSTIVLGAVNDAREKAQVKKKNEIARQYINALELYRNDNPNIGYPTTGNQFECLGYNVSETCFLIMDGSPALNNLIANYYPAMPKNDDFIVSASGNITKGIMYRCPSSDSCYLRWYLPNDQDCIYGKTANNEENHTECTYDL